MGFFADIPPPYAQQAQTTRKILSDHLVFDQSDPGTGKTRSNLDAISEVVAQGGRALVLAPKTILESSWAKDCRKFTPHLSYAVAHATNRRKALASNASLILTNHDAVRALATDQEMFDLLDGVDYVCIDESTAYKTPGAARSKSAAQLLAARAPSHRVLASGTPNPNGILDLWQQVYLLDGGERLGSSFWKFRSTVCEPQQQTANPAHVKWAPKEGALEVVADLIADLVIRHRLEDVVDIPEHTIRTVPFALSPKHRRAYDDLAKYAVLQAQGGVVSAVNKAVLRGKLLQMASGAVYNNDAEAEVFATDRYELVAELAVEVPQSVIAFNWKHQKAQLLKALKARGRRVGLIDGTTKDVHAIVEAFQRGDLTDILAHPKSASHGLTLTAGWRTIWASPTDDAERFQQFNRRIYRSGQTKKTDTLLVTAEDTFDALAYDNTSGKVSDMDLLLAYAHALQEVA